MGYVRTETGDGTAAQSLLSWAVEPGAAREGTRRTAVVTGPPGSGKSRLLALFVAGAAAPGSSPRPVVHAVGFAEGQITRTLAWQLGRHLGYGPIEPAELLRRLGADPRPVLMVVTDLHRSGRGPADLPDARPHTIVENLINPLRALPGVRLILESDTPDLLGGTDDVLVVEMERGTGTEPGPVHQAPHPGPSMAAAPPPTPPARDWPTATPDEREHALDRALSTGTAHQLLRDPGYLVYGSVPAVTAALADPRLPLPPGLRDVWDRAAPDLSAPDLPEPQRAAVLHSAAAGAQPKLAEYLRPLAETGPWITRWSLPERTTAAATLTAAGTFVAADALGRLTRYALADGRARTTLPAGTAWQPAALAPITPDCLLALDRTGALRPLPLVTDAPVPIGLGSLLLHHNAATLAPPPAELPTALAATARHAVVGDGRGRVHLWPLDFPAPETLTAYRPHRSPVAAAACLDVGDTVLVVTGGLDGTVVLWDSASAAPLTEPLERRGSLPTALALADTDAAGPVLAVAWSDRRLHLWHLLSGRRAALPAPYRVGSLALTDDCLLLSSGPGGIRLTRLDPAALWATTAERRAS
ncbi:hypothetical protein [Streptomyces sp.]|uniref:hypothetical protein n=1 Tax=Streptomyces sp. TaxID=1931 RepID=UPI0028111512|nr:hypothetical protein [Streptomyces sp.]